jgi:hypothetical protein
VQTMKQAQARSADAALLARIAAGGWLGRVHSVFARTINVETPAGTLVTLAGCECDDAPDTVIVDAPGFAGTDVVTGDPVTAEQARIVIGARLDVSLRGARPWQEELPCVVDPARLRANLDFLQARLFAVGRVGGMLASASSADAWKNEMARMLAAGVAQVRRCLLRGDYQAFGTHAGCLMGLGPGLTPSGDDFLVGLSVGLHVCKLAGLTSARLCEIVEEHAHRTNAISLAALRHAAAGRVRASIVQLLRQLCLGSNTSMVAPLERVLAIGSTSGTDIVAGIACGAGIYLEREALTASLPLPTLGEILSCQ